MKQQEQYKQRGTTLRDALLALALLALAVLAWQMYQDSRQPQYFVVQPGPAPALSDGLTNGMVAPAPAAVEVYAVPSDTTSAAASVYAADPQRATDCMNAAVARSGVPGCKAIIEALGPGR